MVAFYNAADQELYKKYKFLPQEKYRLGLTLPTDPVAPETIAPVPGGITNTNAFTNSGGGNDFNPAGNMFGEGTAVSPVYGGNPITGGFDGGYGADPISGDLPGGGNIVDEFGTDGNVYSETNFNNIKEEEEKKGFLSRMMNSFKQRTENLPSWAKAGITAAGMINPLTAIPSLISKFGSGDGGPSYGIAGLSDAKKGAYDALASGDMLFNTPGGYKTLTGKNFQAKNYVPNQLEIYDRLKDIKEEELTGWQKKQLLEATAIFKDNQQFYNNQNIKDPSVTTDLVNEFTTTTNNDGGGSATPPGFGITPQGNYVNQFEGGDPGQGGTTSGGTNNSQHGSSGMSKGQHSAFRMARGGRAGYFFGGRVNYKKGGRGRTDAESQYGADSAGSYDSSQNKSGIQQSYGGDNNSGARDNPPNFFVEDKTSIVDTSGLKSKSPEINIDYTDPRNYASLKGSIYNTNILDNDNINVDGTLSGEIGPVSYNTNFTDQGITNTNLTAGNFNADIDANKNYSLGYANNYNGIDYGAKYDNNGNLMFTAGVNFKNGGLAGLL